MRVAVGVGEIRGRNDKVLDDGQSSEWWPRMAAPSMVKGA